MGALSSLKKAKPLVSKFDEALANLSRPKGTGNEFLTEVMKQPGVKKAEIEDRKLKQAFEKAGKITKEQAQEIAKKHASPKIEEKILTEQGEKFDELEKMAERDYGEAFEDLHPDIQDEIEKEFDAAAAKYGDYRMPGGSNYREIIMKLPAMSEAEQARMMTLEAQRRRLPQGGQWVFDTDPEGKELKALKQKAEQSAYYSSHWGKDEPNPLAHMRVQDRVGPNGEKILHVEEIQSDWHQAGRKKGYGNQLTPEERDEMRYLTKSTRDSADDARLNELKEKESRVPDAPFKKNWHELAMKRLINHAAENGYDKIAITPGAEQASRYDLSKQVNGLQYFKNDDGTYHLQANLNVRGGESRVLGEAITPDELEQHIGKEVAQKILKGEGEQLGDVKGKPVSTLRGVDLQVGGEGMKGFYDKMLPDYLNTLGKKYGSQVGVYDMPNPKTGLSITDIQREQGLTDQQWLDLSGDEKMRLIDEMDAKAKAHTTPLHTFDITPELREEITTKGLPLYQQIGLPLGTGVGSYEFNAPEPEYAAGGAVVYNTDPDMSDGGAIIPAAPFKRGGKVKITDNLDEMFMEVNNKKFQRK
jgi:hypothetical protein